MKLEEAIMQTKPFKSESEKLSVNILYTHFWISDRMKTFFAEFGITAKQYNILRILRGAGKTVSTSYIRERLLNNMSDVSRIVDRMESKGMVFKRTCPNDKRLVDVGLNKKGSDMLNNISDLSKKLDNVFKNLTEKEAILLNDLLDKLRGI